MTRSRSTNPTETDSAREPLFEVVGVSGSQLGQVLGLLSGTDVVELDLTFGSTRLSVRRSTSALPEVSSLAIASPLVGIFHPGVKPGDTIAPGQSIGAIDSLGIPTTVDAPRSGTVEEVLVEDGRPVEYGQPLVVLRRPASPGE